MVPLHHTLQVDQESTLLKPLELELMDQPLMLLDSLDQELEPQPLEPQEPAPHTLVETYLHQEQDSELPEPLEPLEQLEQLATTPPLDFLDQEQETLEPLEAAEATAQPHSVKLEQAELDPIQDDHKNKYL